jgi:asparagine synthase (glutamine-hydrolysing)
VVSKLLPSSDWFKVIFTVCRICGIFNPAEQDLRQRVLAMRDAMQHGGPDDAGLYLDHDQPLSLGHRRLSLIDLSNSGHQPMEDRENGLVLVFNGEIYNYADLRATLIQYGHQFRTRTDTEVILKSYLQWGVEGFELFNGMFAFAIWDKRKSQIILARDHAGMKPLYYAFINDAFCFSSEMRAFRYSGISMEENSKWPISFLAFGHLPEPVTTLTDVYPLEKGTVMIVDLPSLNRKYISLFRLKYRAELKNEEEAIHLLQSTLVSAVERHMISDAPLGLFLSGGIDSSLLTIIASGLSRNQLKTLSIIFNEKKFSEEKYQDIIVQKTQTFHGSYNVTKEIFNSSLLNALEAMDQPSIDGINTYFISKYARTHGLKAVLSGIGADELFGGYPSFSHYYKLNAFQQIPKSILNKLQLMPNHRLKKISYGAMHRTVGEYLLLRGIFSTNSIAELLDCSQKEVEEELLNISQHYSCGGLKNGNRISWLETNYYMQNQLLKDADYMSMWHGLEIRMPFLDKELMTMSAEISEHIKFKKNPSKYLLVKSFEKDLPQEIWKRKKQGFTFPFEGWLRENEYTKPVSKEEDFLYSSFQKNELSWARYWCALLMNRFSNKMKDAA